MIYTETERIEALEAEVERLEAALAAKDAECLDLYRLNENLTADLAEREGEIARIKAALTSYVEKVTAALAGKVTP